MASAGKPCCGAQYRKNTGISLMVSWRSPWLYFLLRRAPMSLLAAAAFWLGGVGGGTLVWAFFLKALYATCRHDFATQAVSVIPKELRIKIKAVSGWACGSAAGQLARISFTTECLIRRFCV
eukprot:359768-Chlamydomonas_euryale.AAC.10